MDASLIQSFLRQTEILRTPRSVLSTFGATNIEYHLVSPVEDLKNKTRLREGKVLSEKPKILTAESFFERFEGFGDEAKEFAQWLTGSYRDLLRALEYNFKNQGFATRVISESPQSVARRILAELDSEEAGNKAVIWCPDSAWSLALMKFTLDQSARSFPTHVRDLERRGLFDPAARQDDRRKREIESLFAAAADDPSARERLGRVLREYGLFAEYEDRFLGLFR
ncbi:MAG: hypothetical protein HY549_02330 [Elusimicrobia bacterium]|nr:hypothetical protein [Elusimicrobiota bacterium]